MVRKLSAAFVLLVASAIAIAEESYMGIFMSGKKIGYAASSVEDELVSGRALKRTTSKTVIDAGLLGAALSMTIDLVSWTTPDGKPAMMKFAMSSSGRSQKVEANFAESKVFVSIDNNRSITRKTLSVPTDAPIVDDALTALVEGQVSPGTTRTFYVLDPMTASFVKNHVTLKGPVKYSENGQQLSATLIEIKEPRMAMSVYMSSKGDFLKAVALGGMEMRPMPKEEAIAEVPKSESVDIAEFTRLPLDKALPNLGSLAKVTYKFEGGDFSRAPSDASFTFKRNGPSWMVTSAPRQPDSALKATIIQVSREQPKWLEAGLHIPCADKDIVKQALSIVGTEKRAVAAALRIGAYVNKSMRPNAGIGVLRDAREVIKSKEGVCRDYAILTASLLRSAKIPARLASGMVYAQGALYYHAWVESWDGKGWYGIDSTRYDLKVTPGHIRLAFGSVEDAFMFTFLDRVKVTVASQTMRKESER